jgi:chromosome segregation ATPase
MSDQSNIAELERRITAALGRIGAGLDKWNAAPVASAPDPNAVAGDDTSARVAELEAELAKLKTALAAEKSTVAQLNERLKSVKDREQLSQGQLETKVEKMTQQLDVQGLELQRMRKSTVQLREHLRVLHEAAADNMAEPHLINKAMLAELENLRATRHSETAEMDEILAELKPLIEEARANG